MTRKCSAGLKINHTETKFYCYKKIKKYVCLIERNVSQKVVTNEIMRQYIWEQKILYSTTCTKQENKNNIVNTVFDGNRLYK